MDPGSSTFMNPDDILTCNIQNDYSSEEDDDEAEEKRRDKEIQDALEDAFDDLIDEDEDQQSDPSKCGAGDFDINQDDEYNLGHEKVKNYQMFTSTPKYQMGLKQVQFKEHLNQVNFIPNVNQFLDESTEIGEQVHLAETGDGNWNNSKELEKRDDRSDRTHQDEHYLLSNAAVQNNWKYPDQHINNPNNEANHNAESNFESGPFNQDRQLNFPPTPVHNNWLNQDYGYAKGADVNNGTTDANIPAHQTYSVHQSTSYNVERNPPPYHSGNGDFHPRSAVSHHDSEIDAVTQLRTLYMARGREIEALNKELNEVRERAKQETTVLKGQLVMSKGKQEEMAYSLSELRKVISEKEDLNRSLEGKIAALKAQFDAEKNAKTEVIRKLKAAESTIESLHQQINQLASSESISRAREQSEATIASIKQRHQQEVLRLQQIADDTRHQLQSTKEELAEVQEKLRKQTTQHDQMLLEKAETINHLSKSLEECQHQCQEFLESGKIQEVSYLKAELQRVTKEKANQEQQLNNLKEEVTSLQSELHILEGAAHLGEASTAASDSIAQLGLRKSPFSRETGDVTTSLKAELEKSMTALRNRRNMVTQLQIQLNSLQKALDLANEKNRHAEEKLKNAEGKIADLQSQLQSNVVPSIHLEKEILQLKNEKAEKELEIKELNNKYSEALAREKNLQELNSKMEKDHEDDKQKALAECCETYLKMHTEALNRVQQKLETTEQEKTKVTERYEMQVTTLRTQNQKLADSLEEVKRLYIRVCEEKNNLESKLHEFAELQTKENEVEEEIVNQKCAIMLQAAKAVWQEESEAKFVKLMEVELKKAKEEAKKQRLNDVAEATKMAKLECKKLLEVQLQKEFTEMTNRLLKYSHSSEPESEEKQEVKLELLGHIYKLLIAALRKQHQDLETLYKSHFKDIEDRQHALQTDLADTIKKYENEKASMAEQSKKELEVLKNDYLQVQQALQQRNNEVEKLKEKANYSTHDELITIKQELDKLVNENSELLKEKQHMNAENDKLQDNLKQAHSEMDNLKQKLMKYYKLTQKLEKKFQGDIEKLKDECATQIELHRKSLTSQHAEDLKRLQSEHETYLANLVKKHDEEKRELLRMDAAVKDANQQVQQEKSNEIAMKQLHDIYITSLNNIQAQLAGHIEDVNKRASKMIIKTLQEYKEQIVQKTLSSSTTKVNPRLKAASANSQSDPDLHSAVRPKQTNGLSGYQKPSSKLSFNPSLPTRMPNYRNFNYDPPTNRAGTWESDVFLEAGKDATQVSDTNTEYYGPPSYYGVSSLLTQTLESPIMNKYHWLKGSSKDPPRPSTFNPPPERLLPSPDKTGVRVSKINQKQTLNGKSTQTNLYIGNDWKK